MKITIKRNIAQELECFKIRIDLITRSIKVAIVIFIAGVATIVVCRNDAGVTDTSMTVYLVLEIILFMVSFMIFKNVYKNKKAYRTFFKSAFHDYGAVETYSTITIDEDCFIFESLRKYYKFSWSSLSLYQFYRGDLIIMIDALTNSFVIKSQELSVSEFNELFLFVSKNLTFKKN